MRIGVVGLSGRIGSLVAPEIERQGATFAGGTIRPGGAAPAHDLLQPDIAALARASDAVIDFSVASAASEHAARLAEAGTAWVLGTTGLDGAALASVSKAAERIAIVQSPNFAPGVSLVLMLARLLAERLDPADYDAEIVDRHHRGKRDAPSGTALAIGRRVADGRGHELEAVRLAERERRTDPRRPGGIGFASLRGGAIVGEHELSFTSATEQITLSHRAFDRALFAQGAVLAARWTQSRSPGLYGMDDVLACAP